MLSQLKPQDPEYDLLSTKPTFQLDGKPVAEFDISKEIPVSFSNLESEGLFWISSYIAFEMRNIQPGLGSTDESETATTYANSLNEGAMTHPKNNFLKDVKKFYEFFCTIHEKDEISGEPGIITGQCYFFLYKFGILRGQAGAVV